MTWWEWLILVAGGWFLAGAGFGLLLGPLLRRLGERDDEIRAAWASRVLTDVDTPADIDLYLRGRGRV